MLRFLAGAAAARFPAAALRRLLHAGGGGSGEEAESVAYRMSMLRPPSVVPKSRLTRNSCSLIGRLDAPVRPRYGSCEEKPKAYTFLSVAPSSSASSLSSSNFTLSPSLPIPQSMICVKELNYVLDPSKKPQNDPDSSTMPSTNPEMLKENKYMDRLRLWQVFFASPYEWWDNRQSKPYINCPDFKHKDTREKIWLQPDDPPWVRKQLELHDLEIAANGYKCSGQPLKNRTWKAQDFNYSDDDDDDEVQYSAEA